MILGSEWTQIGPKCDFILHNTCGGLDALRLGKSLGDFKRDNWQFFEPLWLMQNISAVPSAALVLRTSLSQEGAACGPRAGTPEKVRVRTVMSSSCPKA